MLDTYFYSLFYKYIQLLYKANEVLGKIDNLEKDMSYDELGTKLNPLEEEFINLTFAIIRIVSIKKDKDNNYVMEKNSGVIQMANHNKLIMTEISKMKDKYGEVFDTIRIIRNKFEHEPHNIYNSSYVGNNKSTNFTFSYQKETSTNEQKFKCTVQELRSIVLDLNKSFNCIIDSIKIELINKKDDYKKEYDIYFPVYNGIKLKEV